MLVAVSTILVAEVFELKSLTTSGHVRNTSDKSTACPEPLPAGQVPQLQCAFDAPSFASSAPDTEGVVLTANLSDPDHVAAVLRLLRQLEDLGSRLPVELFFAGKREALSPQDRTAIEAAAGPGRVRVRELFGALRGTLGPRGACQPNLAAIPHDRQPFTFYKPLAAAAASFTTVVVLDINLLLFRRPEALLGRSDFAASGLLLFRDYWPSFATDQAECAHKHFGLPVHGPRAGYGPTMPDAVDSSAVLLDKRRFGRALCGVASFIQLGGAGLPSDPCFAGDKDTWLFAAVQQLYQQQDQQQGRRLNASAAAAGGGSAPRPSFIAVNGRKSGFFLKGWVGPSAYVPVWGHLQVDGDGLPLFWNTQRSAPKLGPSSGLWFYNGLPPSPPAPGAPVPSTPYPHHPGGCMRAEVAAPRSGNSGGNSGGDGGGDGGGCPMLPLSGVRRVPEEALRILVAHGLTIDDDALPGAKKKVRAAADVVARVKAHAEYVSSGEGPSSMPATVLGRLWRWLRSPMAVGLVQTSRSLADHGRPNPNRRVPRLSCRWRGHFVKPGEGVVPLFTLDEALAMGADDLPLRDLLEPHLRSGTNASAAKGGRGAAEATAPSRVVHQLWKSRCAHFPPFRCPTPWPSTSALCHHCRSRASRIRERRCCGLS